MKIKRTMISKIDMDKFKEIVSLEESGHISHDEATELFIESKKYECRIDIMGTIKENIKHISDVIKSYGNWF